MGLLEKDRIALKEKEREYLTTDLEDRVQVGKSAERLLTNPDWKRYSRILEEQVKVYNERMIEIFLHQVLKDGKSSIELDHEACNNIRMLDAQAFQLKRILGQLVEEAESGVEAQKEMDKLRIKNEKS